MFTSYHNNGAVGRVQKEESGEEGWGIVNARRANVEVAATPRRRVVMIKMSDARERERARDASDAR